MKEFFTVLVIGIALSMDAFSMALSIGTFGLKEKKEVILSLSVGIMHFIMPLLGFKLGYFIINHYELNATFFAGLILMILSIKSSAEMLKNKEKNFNLNFIGTILFAFSVSIDSFSTGIGLNGLSEKYFLSALMFSLCSFSFTYLGLILGKYIKSKIKDYASFIGILILLIMGLIYMCK